MNLPSWLAGLTGANKFANNPETGFQANLGDLFQSAGHSMAQHYRGKGGTYGGNPLIEGLNAGPGLSTPIPAQPAETLSSILPAAPPIQESELPPVRNAQFPPESRRPALPQQTPIPENPWGQGAIGGIPLALLIQMGLGQGRR